MTSMGWAGRAVTGLAAGALMLCAAPALQPAGKAAGGASALVVELFAGAALAQSDQAKPARKTKRVDAIRQQYMSEFDKINKLLDEKKNAEALARLKELAQEKLNDYEKAIVYQFIGQLLAQDGKYKEAIPYFEEIPTLERAPDAQIDTALNILSQLYLATDQYKKAIETKQKWMARQEVLSPSDYIFLAQAYYGLEDYKNVAKYAEQGIKMARETGRPVEERWWLLLRAAYWELKDFQNVKRVMEILALNYDKPEYWRNLAGVYGELGMDDKALAVMEIAYRRGFLDERERYLINLAQMYIARGAPIKAAWLIERGMKEGKIEKTADNYELLGQAYLNAMEIEKAERPLRLAAQMKNKGELWMRLGQVLVQREKWNEAIEALQKAIDAGDLDKPQNAYLLLGTAYFNIDEFDKAKEAFRAVLKLKDKDAQQSASKWLGYIDSELKRRRQLTEFYDKSGKRRKRS